MSRTKRKIPEQFNTMYDYIDVPWSKHWVWLERSLTKKEQRMNERDGVFNHGRGRTKYKRLWNKSYRAVERNALGKVYGFDDYDEYEFDNTKPIRWRHLDWWYY